MSALRAIPSPEAIVKTPSQLWNPTKLVCAALAVALVFLVGNPLLRLILISFKTPTGAFTFDNYIEIVSRWRYLVGYRNSLVLGFSVASLCLLFGVPMAWGVSRTDMPGKQLIQLLVLATFVTPPFLGATSWVLLAGPNAGWLNRAYMAIFGTQTGLLNIYSFPGLVFVIAIYSFPYTFVFTKAALDLVSSEMEDAANCLGAGRARATFSITLPLIRPALLGAWIITFLEAVAIISSSIIIALPANINLVSLQLWEFFGYPLRVETAAAYAMPLLLVTLGLVLLQRRILGARGYVALTGKGGERRLIDLGAWRWLLLAYAGLVLTCSLVLPYLVLLQAAFAKAWAQGLSWHNLTFANFYFLLFQHSTAKQAILNTIVYSSAAATLALGLAISIAYIVSRRLVRFGNVLGVFAFAPFVIPGMVLAIGFYASYAPPPFALAGTAAILVLAFVTRFLPIAYSNASAAIRGVNPEMEEAVLILGGSRFVAIRRVVGPLLKRSLLGAWLLVFIPACREVSSALFLYGPNTRTMSVLFFDLTEGGSFEQLAALGVILLCTTLVFVGVGLKSLGRDFMLRKGGSE
jgi:iron(III) transport system permease protein